MAKKIDSYVKMQIKAQEATPGPPIGPALGSKGINLMEFCRTFNDRTSSMNKGTLIPVIITIYNDRSFTFILKKPPVSTLIKEALGLTSGSSAPNTKKVAKITRQQLETIVQIKSADLTANDLEAAVRTIAGTAASMGVEVEGV